MLNTRITLVNMFVTKFARLKPHMSVADLEGVPRVPWNPPFGFSCDRKLWKPGLQQNPT